ncbi:Small-conductance mechanosensitive channel [bioreactor metagenome]|uniref:Small-conductance mechanosensitive channel n=1 Tax=bioreactor metagenome TaxID=1076179 RepID=A0A644VE37_9ZZZZ|nr:mechanosensitive ion channel family protein [Methanocorpusculum sp.]
MADLSLLFTGNSFLDTKLIGEITYGDMLGVIIIAVLTYLLARTLSTLLRRILAGKVETSNIAFLAKLLKWTLYFIGFLLISPYLHLDLSGLMVAGGVVAVAFGFASQNTLSNFVAGVLLMFERPVAVGDNISVKETEGYVEDIGLLSTTIRTYKGLYVRIPNASMFSSEITNYVAHIARRFDYDIGIRYTDDADKAVKVIKEVIEKHPYALRSPAPSVFVDELGTNSINLKVRIWCPSGFWWDVKTDLLWKIFKALRKANIDIPFPQLTLWYGEEAPKSTRMSGSNGFTPEEVLGKSELSPENAVKVVK